MTALRSVAVLIASLPWAAACTSGAGDAPPSPRFVVRGPAVVRDAQTGLEWTRRDDGMGLEWHKADAYCQTLSIDDGGGWRLPSIEELRRLYGAGSGTSCGDATCAVDPAFDLTSPYVWSATAPHTYERTYLDFQFGTELSPGLKPRLVRAVLCVRTPRAG